METLSALHTYLAPTGSGSTTLDYAAVGLALATTYGIFWKKRADRGKIPPGPPGLPLLGNIFDMPKREMWKEYLQWSKKYDSDIIRMRVPGSEMFILNSFEVIQDLLIKRSHLYSDRQRSTLILDMINVPWLIAFMDYTDEWKEHRRVFRKEFDSPQQSPYNKLHATNAARRLLRRLLTSSDYHKEVRLASVDAILSVTYGVTPTDFNHPFIKTPEEINVIFADVARGGYLVDIFPMLQYLPTWFPGTKFHQIAKVGAELGEELRMGPVREVKNQVEDGTAVSSIASRFLYAMQEGEDITQKDLEVMTNVLGNAYLGGADTTVCVLQNFVLAMALYPRVQKKAQAAIDAIVSREQRLPTYADQPHLPYITAIVHEVLRWNPVTPFAIYHMCGEEGEPYRGYRIPKGTTLVANLWGCLKDESLFGKDTDKFVPERFMKQEGEKEELKSDLSNIELAFGFGRRSCPGRYMARETIWILVSNILAAYDMVDPTDANGKKVSADDHLEYTNALVSFPPYVQVKFKPRIPESIIHESLASIEE